MIDKVVLRAAVTVTTVLMGTIRPPSSYAFVTGGTVPNLASAVTTGHRSNKSQYMSTSTSTFGRVGERSTPSFLLRRGGASRIASAKADVISTTSPVEDDVVVEGRTTASVSGGDLPSWEDLSDIVSSLDTPFDERKALVTLYRDTNGWCPFCERVWLVLRAKGIPYQEILINLQDKPAWFKLVVPTGLVPAVLIHDDDLQKQEDGDSDGIDNAPKPMRRLVWESIDILKALDESFPDTPQMVHDTAEYKSVEESLNKLAQQGFMYLYSSRNATLTDDDREERRIAFNAALDDLDSHLRSRGDGSEGNFMLGKNRFSALDAIAVPTLERWRHQLPLSVGVDILSNRTGIQSWFDAMDSFPAYRDRVAGDKYSWTAVTSYFLKLFSGNSTDPSVLEAVKRGDAAANALTSSFSSPPDKDAECVTKLETTDEIERAKIEAAKKLVLNHEAVLLDCTNPEPKTQAGLGRVERDSFGEGVDQALRMVAQSLLCVEAKSNPKRSTETCLDGGEVQAKEAARALRIVASRLCAPRDLSAPAAKVLRRELALTADRIEG